MLCFTSVLSWSTAAEQRSRSYRYPTRQLRSRADQAAYRQDSGTVMLHLQPLPLADNQPLVYRF